MVSAPGFFCSHVDNGLFSTIDRTKEQAVNLVNVILAAGFGTRMKSDIPKVMHPLLGRPMVEWAVRSATEASGRPPVLVVGHGREIVEAHLGDAAQYVVQHELLGTGHAVMQVTPVLQGKADAVLVFYADMPLLSAETQRKLAATFEAGVAAGKRPALAMLTVVRDDPQAFGRVVRNEAGEIVAVVEEAYCTPEQLAIKELNPGVYCFDAQWLWENLPKIPFNSKGEYFLTDLIEIAVNQGRAVLSQEAPFDEVNGVNNRIQLANVTQVMQRRIIERHMLNGVTFIDPNSAYVEGDVTIGADTVIWPGCMLQGKTRIGRHANIGPHTQIVDSEIGDHCRVTYSVVEEARMGEYSEIGPFGHLRKGAHLADHVHMGNFGEVKSSYLGPGVKMGHFSYIGDAHIGANTNIGAGTITCNYDGKQKHKTTVGEGAFIGSDTLLVAPVELGDGARTGAGSVVTRDVPPGSLVYGVPAKKPQ
jgi:bifunctional UDP-N-acetylglucosamine pyrophosphorylase/glucosamine-1-phosphate N-acetyltransferase